MNFVGTIVDFVQDDARHAVYVTSTQAVLTNGSVQQGALTSQIGESSTTGTFVTTTTIQPQNTIQRFDLTTGKMLSKWTVGKADGAMDISPDSSTLYIADVTEAVIHVFDINTQTYVDIPVQEPVQSLVVMADNTVVFDYKSQLGIYSYNPGDGTITLLQGMDGAVQLTRDAAHDHALALVDAAPSELWEITGGNVSFITSISSSSAVTSVTISMDGAVLGYVTDGNAFVLSNQGQLISVEPGNAIAFDPVRNNGFILNNSTISQFNLPGMDVIGYTTGSPLGSIGRLVVSDDDSALFALGSSNYTIQSPANILYPTTSLTTTSLALGHTLQVKVNIDKGLPLPAFSALVGTLILSENGQVVQQASVTTDNMVADFDLENVTLGTHNYHEQFVGTANYSDSQADFESDVSMAVTALTVQADAYGRSLAWNLNLTGNELPDPTGIIRVFEKSRLIAQKVIAPDSSGTLGLMFLKPGLHHLHVQFAENSFFTASSADVTVLTKIVPTSVTYVPSAINNWSGIATINVPAGLAFGVSGTVTLLDHGRVLAQVPASKMRFAVNLGPLKPGSHRFTVRYSGNAPFRPSQTAASMILSAANRPVGSTVNSKILLPLN